MIQSYTETFHMSTPELIFMNVAARKHDRLVLEDEGGSSHFTLQIANT